MKERSLPLAIGLNILLPGMGYMYMRKWIVGIGACLLAVGIFATAGTTSILLTWVVLNVIMAIDMVILNNKNKAVIALETTKKCPNCAELIKREAKSCRFCNAKLDSI